MRTMLLPLALWVTASCAPAPDAYVFRNDDRPAYTRTASVDDLKAMAPDAVTILDVRLSEDFAASPTMIPGASHHDPEAIADWASKLPRDKPVVVYCVKGKWVSQKAATYLSEQGFDVRSLEGGIDAWDAQ
ncbi:MAG: thiosulfate sulfurtransferase GlpE [Hyphomonadaceae bacterium]